MDVVFFGLLKNNLFSNRFNGLKIENLIVYEDFLILKVNLKFLY